MGSFRQNAAPSVSWQSLPHDSLTSQGSEPGHCQVQDQGCLHTQAAKQKQKTQELGTVFLTQAEPVCPATSVYLQVSYV